MVMSEDPTFSTPTRGPHSNKFNINHGHFITNLEKQESPSKMGNYTPGGYSTSKVIESLHTQIDELTKANLKMTSQCHQLVTELESSRKEHQKQMENIARLQTENLNLNSILERKKSRLDEVESSLRTQKESTQNLESKCEESTQTIEKLTKENERISEECHMYKAQYDAIVDSHLTYKQFYTSEVNALKQDLATLKHSLSKQLETKVQGIYTLDEQIKHKLKELESAQSIHQQQMSQELDTAVLTLDLNSWQSALKESQELLRQYKKQAQSDDTIPQDAGNSPLPQLRNPKRKTSGMKRTSFYGTPASFSISSSRQGQSSVGSTSLPGLKRAASVKISTDRPNSATT